MDLSIFDSIYLSCLFNIYLDCFWWRYVVFLVLFLFVLVGCFGSFVVYCFDLVLLGNGDIGFGSLWSLIG